MSARTHDAYYMTKGERGLTIRALRYYIHEQQVMIQEARLKYPKHTGKDQEIFADHKQHHEQAIDAAENLIARYTSGTIKHDPQGAE